LNQNILWLHQIGLSDLARVGGKNSSLGEMIGNLAQLGVSVPGGFATTAEAYKDFIAHNDLSKRIFDRLEPWTSRMSMRWPWPARKSATG